MKKNKNKQTVKCRIESNDVATVLNLVRPPSPPPRPPPSSFLPDYDTQIWIEHCATREQL